MLFFVIYFIYIYFLLLLVNCISFVNSGGQKSLNVFIYFSSSVFRQHAEHQPPHLFHRPSGLDVITLFSFITDDKAQ